MAERRMLTKKVTDDDNFMSLSSSAQALYLHLSMSADDDGFCNQVSISMFKAHASVQDLQALLEKRYIYQFENGVIVIKHWRLANALRKDRYTPTIFQEELSKLDVKDTGEYAWLPDGCQMVAKRLPQDRLGKNSIGKNNNNNISAEPDKQTHALSGIKLSLVDGTEFDVPLSDIEAWTKAYPAVNVEGELFRMNAWLISNPTKKKTRRGIRKFINSWLGNTQDRGGSKSQNNNVIESKKPKEEEPILDLWGDD